MKVGIEQWGREGGGRPEVLSYTMHFSSRTGYYKFLACFIPENGKIVTLYCPSKFLLGTNLRLTFYQSIILSKKVARRGAVYNYHR